MAGGFFPGSPPLFYPLSPLSFGSSKSLDSAVVFTCCAPARSSWLLFDSLSVRFGVVFPETWLLELIVRAALSHLATCLSVMAEGDRWLHDKFDDTVDEGAAVNGDLRTTLQRAGSDLRGQIAARGRGGQSADLRSGLRRAPNQLPGRTVRQQVTAVLPSATFRRTITQSVPAQATRKPAARTVPGLLEALDLSRFAPLFEAEEIDWTAFTLLNEEDLKELGLPLGARKKILAAIPTRQG